jgi:hypothetical protein
MAVSMPNHADGVSSLAFAIQDAIKAIVSSEQTRSNIEDAVNELTVTVQRLKERPRFA